MVEEEEFARLLIDIVADVKGVKDDLKDIKDATKDTAKALSVTGIAARKAFLGLANSSVLAQSVMTDLQDIVGLFADEIFEVLLPAIEPVIEFLFEMVDAFSNLDKEHKIVVAAIVAVAGAMWLISAHPIVGTLVIVGGLLILAEKKFGLLSKAAQFLKEHWDVLTAAVSAFLVILQIAGTTNPLLLALTGIVAVVIILQREFGILNKIIDAGMFIIDGITKLFEKLDFILFGGSVIPHLKMMTDIINISLMPAIFILKGALEGLNFMFEKADQFVGSISKGLSSIQNITNTFTQNNLFFGGAGGGGPPPITGMISGGVKSIIGF